MMNEKKQREFSFMRDWCAVLLAFMDLLYPDDPFKKDYWKVLNAVYEKRSLRQMRMVYHDINEMADGIYEFAKPKLNEILRERFGRDMNDRKGDVAKRMDEILERGHLRSNGEYRLVRDWIDQIFADDRNAKTVEALEGLMMDYEEKMREEGTQDD